MKMTISASGTKITDLLDGRFGRCDYFQLYNTETRESESIENDGKSSSQGAGIAASQQIVDAGAEVLITGSLGPNAYNILADSGIVSYSAGDMTVEEAISAYREGRLEKITNSAPAHSGMNRYRGGQ